MSAGTSKLYWEGLKMEYSKNEHARQLYEVAIGLVKSGRTDIAEDTYQLALQLDPDDFQSITNLAVIIDKSGRLEEAEGLYLKAADFPFYDAVAMYNLGYLFGRTGRKALAETWYRRALVAEPDNFKALVNLANLEQELHNNVAEAKQLLESALKINPKDSIAIDELANIYRLDGELFLAEMLYFKAVDCEPSSPLANYNLASFMEEKGESEVARHFFDLAYSLDPEGKLKKGDF